MKKYDPRMHSAEHILNQTMDRMYQCGRCFNAHIERKKSKCDYHFHKALSPTEIEEIQTRVNQIIESNLPVKEHFVTRSAAEDQFNVDKLPADAGDRIRIVSIGDYDHCPCIGPHVASTAEIGKLKITSTAFDDGILRIRYKLEN
jgi:Ser-tRNA(Ala) deacylase AlaX